MEDHKLDFISSLLAAVCVVFLAVLMLPAGRRVRVLQRISDSKAVRKYHALYGFLLLAAGLVHGIMAGKQPGMISGKILWMFLAVLMLLSPWKRRKNSALWKSIHRWMALAVGVLFVVHLVAAVLG